MNSLMGRILDVNQLVQHLLDGGHPSSTEVRSCQDHLNSRYGIITLVTIITTTCYWFVKFKVYSICVAHPDD